MSEQPAQKEFFGKPINFGWYQGLRKPRFNPPRQVFPIIWTILYFMMAWSFIVYLKAVDFHIFDQGVYYFIAQLMVNLLWSYLFFSKRQILLAAIDIVIMIILVALTISKFKETSSFAAQLLYPYFIWICIALYLNIQIFRLNRGNSAKKD